MPRGAMLAAAILALAAVEPLAAHHSFAAQYDATQPVTLHGVVTRIEWRNPHVYFYVDVTDQDGARVSSWAIEMGPPHQLERRGWKRNSMQIGDVVLVEATRARDGSALANARKVTLEKTGELLGAASSEAQTIGRE